MELFRHVRPRKPSSADKARPSEPPHSSHPSGRTRITAAMRWKAEHPQSTSAEEMARPLFTAR
jgi:hypothetical protein